MDLILTARQKRFRKLRRMSSAPSSLDHKPPKPYRIPAPVTHTEFQNRPGHIRLITKSGIDRLIDEIGMEMLRREQLGYAGDQLFVFNRSSLGDAMKRATGKHMGTVSAKMYATALVAFKRARWAFEDNDDDILTIIETGTPL